MHPHLTDYLARGWALIVLYGVDHEGNCLCGRTDENHRKQAGKHPPHSSWQANGLRDPAVIEATFADGRANVGVLTGAPSGFWVLDVDPDNGGDARLAELEAINGPLPPTRIVRTGSGGRHYLWAMPGDEDVTNARGSLPPGIDVRGTGGQVVAPPSTTAKGSYSVEVDAPVGYAPAWLVELIRTRPEPRTLAHTGIELGLSSAAASERTRAYAVGAVYSACAELNRAPEGTRNEAAFKTACQVLEITNAPWSGITYEQGWQAWYGAAATSTNPLPDDELVQCWRHAATRVGGRAREFPALPELGFQGLGTSSAPAPLAAVAPTLTGAVGPRPGEPDDPVAAFISRLLTPAQLRELPAPEALVDGMLYLDSTAWVIGKSGEYKSFVVLDMSLSIAAGRSWHGHETHRGGVLYVVAEGARGISARVDAWLSRQGLTDGDVAGITFYPMPVQAGDPAAWGIMTEAVRRLAPALVVLDTQARVTVGIDENSNTDMGVFIERCEELRRAAGSCVVLVHHTNAGGGARGATALRGAAQTELTVSRGGEGLVTVKTTKQKDAPEHAPIELRVEPVPAHDSIVLVPIGTITAGSLDHIAKVRAAAELAASESLRVVIDVMSDTFHEGRGGTKAEIREVWTARWLARPRSGVGAATSSPSAIKSTFYRAFNKATDLGIVGLVSGTSSFRYVSPDLR